MTEAMEMAKEVPKEELINGTIKEAERLRENLFEVCTLRAAEEIGTVLRHLLRDLDEAQKAVSLYWDGVDMMNDGPDDSDVAHAQAQIRTAHSMSDKIALAYRIREKRRAPPPTPWPGSNPNKVNLAEIEFEERRLRGGGNG